MNIRDRLNVNKKKSTKALNLQDDNLVDDIFLSNEKADKIISNVLKTQANILFVSKVGCDASIIASYLKHKSEDKSSVLITDKLDENTLTSVHKRIIVPNCGVSGLIKVLERILIGYCGFSVGLTLKSFDNIVEDIQTLISLHYPNMLLSQINNLISSAELVLVCIDKDDDGLFFIKSVSQIIKINDDIKLRPVFPIKKIIKKVEKSKVVVTKQTVPPENSVEVCASDVIDAEKPEQIKKINKYKLLKEKIKTKRG